MPNWAEGTLKLRGKKKDIDRFLREQLVHVTWTYGNTTLEDTSEERPVNFRWEKDGEDELNLLMEEPQSRSCIWMRDTQRTFLDLTESIVPDIVGCYFDRTENMVEIPVRHFTGRNSGINEEDEEILIVLPYRAAWSVHEETEKLFRHWSGIVTHI